MFNLVEYRQSVTCFLSEKNRALHRYSAGITGKNELFPVYEKYKEALFSDEIVAEIFDSLFLSDSSEARNREWFARFAFEENFAERALVTDLPILDHLSSEDYYYEQFRLRQSLSSNEAHDVYDRIRKTKITCKPFFARRMEIKRETYTTFNDYPGFSLQGKGLLSDLSIASLELLKRQLEKFIGASDDYYELHLHKFASGFLNVSPGSIEPWQIPLLLQGKPFDALFEQWSPMSLVKRTLMGLGVDIKKVDNITIDMVKRRGKSLLPLCTRVQVPSEINVSQYPVGGVTDILNLFHILGEALQSAHVASDKPVEFLQLGDHSLWHTWGFLFQYLLLNHEWIKDFLRLDEGDDFRDFLHFRKLYLLRSRAVTFIRSLEYLQGGIDSFDSLCSKTASMKEEVLKHRYDPELAFSSITGHFGTVDFLRGWIFEAELREILVSKFGERWYSRPGAGDFLKELWSYGQQFSAPELAAKIRHLELDINPLRRELEPQ